MKFKIMKFKFDGIPEKYHSDFPFDEDELVLFLGEIENMQGHCVVAKKNGKVLWGFHTDNFFEVSEDEI